MKEKICSLALLVLLLLLIPCWKASAEIDPERRSNLELGFAGPLRSSGPFGGYGMLIFNRPHFPNRDTYLFTIVSPYLYGEIMRDKWPAQGHAVGFGLGGGFLNNDFQQVREGRYLRNESFRGHGGDAAFSYYLRPSPIGGLMPVEGMVRLTSGYARYQRTNDTDAAYVLPDDSFIHSARVGVRVGGVPPELFPREALEFSLWHKAAYREQAGPYGLPGRGQETEHLTQQTWGRLGGVMPVRHEDSAALMLSAGTSGRTDELSCYRLGSGLRFQDEFPYILHGYYFREVFARSFLLLNASYKFPPVPSYEFLQLRFNYDYALIDFPPGHHLARHSLNGLGTDLILRFGHDITLTAGYGYGINAPRHDGFGGHQLNVMFEWKL